MPEHTPPIEATADAFVFKQERVDRMPATEVKPCLPELDAVDMGVKKQETAPIFSKFSHMPEREAASLMPKTPSRTLSAPSKHIEASRQIFSKERTSVFIMDFAMGVLDSLVKLFPSLEDAAEFGKTGRYYVAESMLVYNAETGNYNADVTPSYGKDTLEAFFEKVAREGLAGQEFGDQAVFKGS